MELWWRPSEKAKKDPAEPFPRIEAESRKPNLFLKAKLLLLNEHLQRKPSYGKGKGRPLPAQGTPLANLTTIKLSRKKVQKIRPKVCGMLCKVHPELYIPPLTQPIKNAPDLYHFKKLGMMFWLEDGGLWSGLWVVVCWSDGLIWWSGRDDSLLLY